MIKRYVGLLLAAVVITIGMTACGGQPDVSFNSLEEAKGIARENAMYNAQNFRQESTTFKGWAIESNGDSSQTNSCPQGDGWATLTFVGTNMEKVKVKCSTVSGATGCLADKDFKEKPFAADDGHCQPTNKVPYPLPKIAK